MNHKLREIAAELPRSRRQFEMEVEASAIEVIEMAKQISQAIGEVSIEEAKTAIIKEFTQRLMK